MLIVRYQLPCAGEHGKYSRAQERSGINYGKLTSMSETHPTYGKVIGHTATEQKTECRVHPSLKGGLVLFQDSDG